jgi:membrane fusion protein, heavy metal efflux system
VRSLEVYMSWRTLAEGWPCRELRSNSKAGQTQPPAPEARQYGDIMRRNLLPSALLGGCALLLAGCSPKAVDSRTASPAKVETKDGRIRLPAGSPKLGQIRTALVEEREVPWEELAAPGKVELNPNRVTRVAMPTPGRVRGVFVKLGDAVAEGQPLLSVESQEASGAFAAYSQAEQHLRQATSTQTKAQKDVERLRTLFEHGAAAQKDLIGAENDVVQSQAAVEQSRAEIEGARQHLQILGLEPHSRSHEVVVRAPIAGKVLEIAVTQGEYRNDTSASLMTIADLRTVWVTSSVPESQIRLIQVGERVDIELSAYPGEIFRGQVKRIADMVDPDTRTVKVQAELSNPGGRLRPEMFGNMRHSHGTRRLAVVAANALVQGEQGASVYVEQAPGVFQRVTVTVGDARNGAAPVLAGLHAGDRVVIDGAVLLRAE